jgi:hypothetical protein
MAVRPWYVRKSEIVSYVKKTRRPFHPLFVPPAKENRKRFCTSHQGRKTGSKLDGHSDPAKNNQRPSLRSTKLPRIEALWLIGRSRTFLVLLSASFQCHVSANMSVHSISSFYHSATSVLGCSTAFRTCSTASM